MAQRLLNRARYYQRVVQRRLDRHALIARTDTATRLFRETDRPIARVVSVVSHADRFDQALPPILTRTAAARLMPERALDSATPAALPAVPISAPQDAAEESAAATVLPQNLPVMPPFQAQPSVAASATVQESALLAAPGQAVAPRAVAVAPQAVSAPGTQAASTSVPSAAESQTVQRFVAPPSSPILQPVAEAHPDTPAMPAAAPAPTAQPLPPIAAPAVSSLMPEAPRQVVSPVPEVLRPVQQPAPSDTLLPRSAPVWSRPLETPPAQQAFPTPSQAVAREGQAADVAQVVSAAPAMQPASVSDPVPASTGAVRLSELTKLIKGMMRKSSDDQAPSTPAQTPVAPAPAQRAPSVAPDASVQSVNALSEARFAPLPESAAAQQSMVPESASLSASVSEPVVAPQQVVPPQPMPVSQSVPQQVVPGAPVVPSQPFVPPAEARPTERFASQPMTAPVAQQPFVPPAPGAPVVPSQPFVPPAEARPTERFAAQPMTAPVAQQPFVPPAEARPTESFAAQPMIAPVAQQPFVPPAEARPTESFASQPMTAPVAQQPFVPPAPGAPVVPSQPFVSPAEARPTESFAAQPMTAPVVPPVEVSAVEHRTPESVPVPQPAPDVTAEAAADQVPLSELTKMIKGMMRSANEAAPSPQPTLSQAETQGSAPEQIQRTPTDDAPQPSVEPELPTVSTMKTASGQEVEVRRPRGPRPQIAPAPRPSEANQVASAAPPPEPEGQFRFNMDPNKDRSPEAWRQRLIAQVQFEREQAARKAGLVPPTAPVPPAVQPDVPAAQPPSYQAPSQVPVQPTHPVPSAQSAQPTQPVSPQPTRAVPAAQPQPAQSATQPQATVQQAPTSATVQRQPTNAPVSDDRSPQAWVARLSGRARGSEQTPSGQTQVPGAAPVGPVVPAAPVGAVEPMPAPAADTYGEHEGVDGPETDAGAYDRPQQGGDMAAAAEVPVSARIAIQDSSPTPLPESARRFLQPLVGIDPADVRIYQGALADQVAVEHNADAVTVGEDVFLAAGNEHVSPSTLGLLAHELTHVARQREEGFAPPTAADQANSAPGEERLAETVEANVLQTARRAEQHQSELPSGSAPVLDSDGMWGTNETVRSAWSGTPHQPSAPLAAPTRDRSTWNGLPAPWEPLPDWLAAPVQEARMQDLQSTGLDSVFTNVAPAALNASMSSANNGAQPTVQLAEVGRSVESNTTEPAAPSGGEGGEQGKMPEPDLDALARQVYSLLKQRLATERRRGEI